MKNRELKDCQNEVAKLHGYRDWDDMIRILRDMAIGESVLRDRNE